jgi:hypothetical protein
MDTKDEILKLTERGLEVFNFYMPFAFRLMSRPDMGCIYFHYYFL